MLDAQRERLPAGTVFASVLAGGLRREGADDDVDADDVRLAVEVDRRAVWRVVVRRVGVPGSETAVVHSGPFGGPYVLRILGSAPVGTSASGDASTPREGS